MSLKLTFFNIINSIYKARDFSFFMLALSLFILPLSVNLSSITLVTSLVLKFTQSIFFKHNLYSEQSLKNSSLIGLLFFVYIFVNSIIQTNFKYTIKVFEEEFSHFGLLFLAPMLLRKKEDNKLLSYTLAFGLIAAVLFVIIKSYVLQIDFDKVAFIKTLDIHHTYLSIFILFFVNILLASIPKKTQINYKFNLLIYSISILAAFVLLFILGSKVSMIIYLAFILATVFIYLFKNKSKKVLIIIPVLVVCFF
jgi:O-antigen ligase